MLASNETITIVCMGCRQAPWERVWRSEVAFFFNQDGGSVFSVLVAPRKREGRREEPSMVMVVAVEKNQNGRQDFLLSHRRATGRVGLGEARDLRGEVSTGQ